MNYVFVPADKAANNVLGVWRLYYINTLKREFVDTNAYKLQPSLSERVIVDWQREWILSFKNSSLWYGISLLTHKVTSLESYYFYYARA